MKKLLPIIIIAAFLILVYAVNSVPHANYKVETIGNNANLPTVAIITTGGTIAEKTGAGGAVPSVSGQALVDAVPGLLKLANIQVVQFSNIDSSQMTPELWYKLSETVSSILQDSPVAGAVVTHGTDTIAVGAYFLDLTVASNKPVIFVGAMRDASDLSPDGPANIYNAVLQAVSPEAKNWGTTVTMNQYIQSARDVRKTQSTNVQTFQSGLKGYLGYIEQGKIVRINDRLRRQVLQLPYRMAKVDLLQTFAGDDGKFIRYAVDSGTEGIVIEGVGAGNVNAQVYEAIEYALAKDVPVIITTRVYYGGVWPIYGDKGGGATLQKSGAILAGDLTGPKARILLMLALPQARGNFKELNRYFSE
ncbi:asparaginase [Candidatus Woesearchaeota archaeon]|nr:asparaginase [Candidatus Woesearchaeota archaeon]